MWGVKLLCLLFFTIQAITTTAEEIPVSIPDGLIPTHPYDNENLTACDQDQDCGVGKYCLQSHCESCVPCETLLLRHPPSSLNSTLCAKTFEECGPCLTGYNHQTLNNDRKSDKCFPIIHSDWISDFITDNIIIIICIILIWLSIISIYLAWKKLKKFGSRIGKCFATCMRQTRKFLLPARVVPVIQATNNLEPNSNSTLIEDIELGNNIPNSNTSNGLQLNFEVNGQK